MRKTIMRKLNKLILSVYAFVLVFLGAYVPSISAAHAQVKDYSFKNIDVTFELNSDSTMVVTEKVTYKLDGEFSVLERGIPLVDAVALEKCQSNPALQCGGFDYIEVLSSDFDGESKDKEDLNIFETQDVYGSTIFHIEHDFGKTNFDGDEVVWTLKYKIYGGIGYFENYGYDLFYWDTLPPERLKPFEKARVEIKFPQNVTLKKEDISVLGGSFNYNYKINSNGVELRAENLQSYQDFTVLVKFPRGIIKEPSEIILDLKPETQTVEYLGIKREVEDGGSIKGLPAGDYSINFSAPGHKKKNIEVALGENEEKELSVELEQSAWVGVLKSIFCVINILGCIVLPLIVFAVFLHWNSKGKDRGGKGTIVPWFKPPEGIQPYLLGSLKDEKVDLVDITSTIIDSAYRGFIKIKEESKDEYEFTKLKPFDELGDTEKLIMTKIFASGDSVSTADLKNKFYKELPAIKDAIYDEMVSKKYFDKRPDKVKSNYGCLAIGLMIVGGVIFVWSVSTMVPFFATYGLFAPVTPQLGIFVLGFALLLFSASMAVRTVAGTILYEKVKGFYMYLHTAERYRLQNLTPDLFEKFLSYAVVFGVEKEWAKAFEGIYKGKPDWYESSSPNFNTIYLANSLGRMNSSTAKAMAASPSSNSKGWGSGGGWSGGGGFSGGFSGGGGGGGSIGIR